MKNVFFIIFILFCGKTFAGSIELETNAAFAAQALLDPAVNHAFEAAMEPDLKISSISVEELNREESMFTYLIRRYDLSTGSIRVDLPPPPRIRIIRKVSFEGGALKVTHRLP